MDKRCDTEYTGSKMCTWEEIESSPPEGLLNVQEYSWRRATLTGQDSLGVDVDLGTNSYTNARNSCNSWTTLSDSNYYMGAVLAAGDYFLRPSSGSCSNVLPIACCK